MNRRKLLTQIASAASGVVCGSLDVLSPTTQQRSIVAQIEGIPSGWLKIIGPFGPCWYNPKFLQAELGGNGLVCLKGDIDYSPHMKLEKKLPPLERLAT